MTSTAGAGAARRGFDRARADALDQVEEIAAVPGVGLLFVGANDLSLTLGSTVDGLLDGTSPDSALDRILAAGRAAGVPALT